MNEGRSRDLLLRPAKAVATSRALHRGLHVVLRNHEDYRRELTMRSMAYCASDVILDRNVEIQDADRLRIGARTSIAPFTMIWAYGGVTIGEEVFISSNCAIVSATHPKDATERAAYQRECAPVVIEDRAWIGFGVAVLPGVTIGAEAIVGAGAVVTRDVPAGATVVGLPARPR